MVKRKLATLTASLALMIPASALALGLGNISMNSTLDQILKAEISIQSATPEDLKGLTIDLASAATFARYGIERPAFLEGLQFEVIQGGNGKNYIQLSSLKPIREPFLNFLVEAKWPNGHTLRQFTVLVDPPTMMEAVPLQVAPVRVTKPMPAAKPQRIAAEPMAGNRAPVSNELQSSLKVDNATGAIEYGPSKSNDTLWGIALEMRGNRDASVHQMMLAILRDNPDAFYRGNVNNLKMGYVLRINDPASITSVSSAAAEREIARQYQDWKSGRDSSAEPMPAADTPEVETAAETQSESKPAPAAMEKAESAQLKLASAGAVDSGMQGTAVAEGSGGMSEALALANEELLANRQETQALQDRLLKLEEQIETLQRLVQLKDNQIASVQQGLAKAPQQAVTSPEPVEESLFDSPVALGLIALVVVLLGLLGYLLLQRRRQEEYQESILSQSAGAPVSEVSAVAEAGDAISSQGSSESSLLTDFSTTAMEGLQTDIGEIDPISEADVYLAYGRYSQAEEIINDALQNDSSREEYHVKLLEIYHAAGEKEKFLEASQRFHSNLNGDQSSGAWAKVCVMGREVLPGNALFEGSADVDADVLASSQVLDEVESLESDHVDEFAAAESGTDKADDGSSKAELDSFDFDSLDDQDATLSPRTLDDSFADFENQQLDSSTEEDSVTPSESEESNSLEFDSGSMDELKAGAADDLESKQKLDDEISENSLDFAGSLDIGEPITDTEVGESIEEEQVAESMDKVEQPEEPEFDLTHSLDETVATDELADFNFDSSDNSENSATAQDSIETDLEDLASALENNEESSSGDVSLDTIDLSSPADLEDDGSDFDDDNPFADLDEVGTKLDLARAYVDMGDEEGAKSIIDEVMNEGTDEQKEEAQALLKQL